MYSDDIKREREQILSALFSFDVKRERIEMLEPLIDNVCWMRVKLDEARDTIKSSQIAIPYDNGGGQKGIRENPLFKGYTALFKSYLSGLNQIMALLPDDVREEETTQADAPQSVLEMIRSKHTA